VVDVAVGSLLPVERVAGHDDVHLKARDLAAPPAEREIAEVSDLKLRGTERLRAAGIPDEKARLIGAVVSTAIEEMGQPYVWGGTGDGSGGFDCSGLIYFAYGRHNVRIPRTSAGQSAAGIAIQREQGALLPGDILTFSETGSQVTHVGLYVGEDRFIHSAAGGVRLSRLAEDDPYGRYWLRRWVGLRRVVE
jgi:cell wall-associated NlpC family hydrolase